MTHPPIGSGTKPRAIHFGDAAEAAAYIAVREAIDDALTRGATWLHVTVVGELELAVEDDGAPRTSSLVHVQDRIGALGGTVEVEERTLQAVIPCA